MKQENIIARRREERMKPKREKYRVFMKLSYAMETVTSRVDNEVVVDDAVIDFFAQ